MWAYIVSLFAPIVTNILTKLVGAFGAIVTELPSDEAQILHDAMAKFVADRNAGKPYGEAAADALDTFYNENKGEVSKVGKQLFSAFLSSVENA